MKKLVLVVVGTRPEAIKLIPVYQSLKNSVLYPFLVATNQHKALLQQTFDLFGVEPDHSLNIMKENQTLDYLTSAIIQKMHLLFTQLKPTMVIVQGDTATAFGSALAAFYLKIPIAHVEAGLRTGSIFSPFPEEMNRRFIAPISQLHFTPTPLAMSHLLREGIPAHRIFCVGNTVVDALGYIKNKIANNTINLDPIVKTLVEKSKQENRRLILLTCHRRESFNGGLLRILKTIKIAAELYPDLMFVFPVHPNPHVQQAVEQSDINMLNNILCIKPVSYENLLYILLESEWVITDSGGIQEEAISLGKRILILREHTERMEAIWEGLGVLTGCNEEKIMETITLWYNTSRKDRLCHIYGNGQTSKRIVSILENTLFPAQSKESTVKKSYMIKGAGKA